MSLHGDSDAGNLGLTYKGFSIDGVYMNEKGAVNAQLGTLGVLPGPTPPATPNSPPGADVNSLYYFLTNNEAYSIMGKYTFEFGGGFKDGACSFKDVLRHVQADALRRL